MATQNSGRRGLSRAAAAGAAFAAGALTALAAYQRWHEASCSRANPARRLDVQRARLADYQRLQLRLLDKAMDDPDLAAVMSTVETESPAQRRQYLFANALYANAVFGYRIGIANLEELRGHLRVLVRNPIFRAYWEATRPHRASLRDGSEEGRVGRMVDALIRDLDEADTDEWWVVGEPPTE
ncbi:hypothetical protein EDD90_3069 [Streptomyces sp. Ag109_O5-1]|uniref:DUF6082 family protein n=1 Tax=Streptomyces TaxID=1883 RepID=UPI000F4EFB64|nr:MULTISPECIES: DUF6082 family protein [Streptomyces]RPE40040.1 hypothetical protein EDD90_3069 [Streptomyces sp. Ag109_O5-1]